MHRHTSLFIIAVSFGLLAHGLIAEEAIVTLAKELRCDVALPAEVEHGRANDILAKAHHSLPDYSCEGSMECAINSLIAKTLNVAVGEFSVVDIGDTPLRGRSKDPVYIVNDKQGQRQYVVKAFRNPCSPASGFLAEISAMNLIEELALPHVGAIKPLGFGRYCDGCQEWGLLLETAASGKRLDEYIFPLRLPGVALEERAACIKSARSALARMGYSLAALHSIKATSLNRIPSVNLERYTARYGAILGNAFICRELSRHCCMQEFIANVERIKSEALSIPVLYSYWHGDAHFGNMFYDEHADEFYFVDVARMHQSVDYYGQPMQDGALDLQRVEESFRISALEVLSEEEYNSLLADFYQSYAWAAGQLPDSRLLKFYKTFMLLGRLMIYARYVDEKNEVQRLLDKSVFESALKDFKSLIFG